MLGSRKIIKMKETQNTGHVPEESYWRRRFKKKKDWQGKLKQNTEIFEC